MKRSYYLYILLIAAVVAAVVLFPTEKKRIQNVIEKGTKAVMNENTEALMDLVSFNYSDDYGGSYLNIEKRAGRIFRQFDRIDATVDTMRISVDEDRASADLRVTMIVSEGERRGYLVGNAEGPQNIKMFFEKAPYKWKVNRIEGVSERDEMP